MSKDFYKMTDKEVWTEGNLSDKAMWVFLSVCTIGTGVGLFYAFSLIAKVPQ